MCPQILCYFSLQEVELNFLPLSVDWTYEENLVSILGCVHFIGSLAMGEAIL